MIRIRVIVNQTWFFLTQQIRLNDPGLWFYLGGLCRPLTGSIHLRLMYVWIESISVDSIYLQQNTHTHTCCVWVYSCMCTYIIYIHTYVYTHIPYRHLCIYMCSTYICILRILAVENSFIAKANRNRKFILIHILFQLFFSICAY